MAREENDKNMVENRKASAENEGTESSKYGRRWNVRVGEEKEVVIRSNEEKEKKEAKEEKEEKEERVMIRSNGLTQTDRDYFNIVKTEDGVSNFFRVEHNQVNSRLRKQQKRHNFVYHSVRGEEGERVAALYLPEVT